MANAAAAAAIARNRCSRTSSTANDNPDTPLLTAPDLGVLLDTGPEVLTGSTRMKAGTPQKIALNRITTAAMVLAGRVRENHMIDLTGTNAKLRRRAARIVCDLAGCTSDQAVQLLEANAWSVRSALGVAHASEPPPTDTVG